LSLGLKKENIKQYEHPKEGLAHYSKRTIDIQYNYPFGWKELTGLANRTDFDLKSHEESSGKDMKYFDPSTSSGQAPEKYWPYVIEPTLGIERLMLAVICDAYEEVEGGRSENTNDVIPAKAGIQSGFQIKSGMTRDIETVLHFSPSLAPVKVAVLPLTKKLSEEARKVYQDLKSCYGDIEFDEAGSIGRRYRRQDEIGTPFCVTFDFDSIDDKKVTVRDRDTMKQERIAIADLKNFLFEKLI
jgi:glycyl-tRNA synthetase